MNHDKAFAIYAIALVGAVMGLISVTVILGVASLPGIAFIVEHVALALAIRTAYKSFDGSNPVVDFLEYTGWKTPEMVEAPADAVPSAA